MSLSYENTVKPVYEGHSRDQKMGSLYRKPLQILKTIFYNHIFHKPYILSAPNHIFHGGLFLSYRDAIFISRIVIKRIQGLRMSSKGLHMLSWLNPFLEQILNIHSKYFRKITSFCMLISAIFFKILSFFKTSFKQIF